MTYSSNDIYRQSKSNIIVIVVIYGVHGLKFTHLLIVLWSVLLSRLICYTLPRRSGGEKLPLKQMIRIEFRL